MNVKNAAVPRLDTRVLRSSTLVSHVANRHRARACNFALNTCSVLAEPAQVASLLSAELGTYFPASLPRKTFFCGSGLEALHGAIKLARHYWKRRGGRTRVAISDPRGELRRWFDPLDRGPEDALIPGVSFHPSLGRVLEREALEGLAAVVARPGEDAPCLRAVQGTLAPLFVLDLGGVDTRRRSEILAAQSRAPDIVVWGDELSASVIPFGAFSAVAEVFLVWETLATCFLHSSTYGGNGQALSYVRDALVERAGPAGRAMAAGCEVGKGKRAGHAQFVNRARWLHDAGVGFDFDVLRAEGHELEVRHASGETARLVDCVGGIGCSLRGHNPRELGHSVLRQDGLSADYWGEVEALLGSMSGLDSAFPAVSGASAVETAMTLALLARPARRKILVFRQNFAGKTLAALTATAQESDRQPFTPLYRHTVYVDAASPHAAEELESLIFAGDVALVWTEYCHGDGLCTVPEAVVHVLARAQDECGVLVGFDEVLHGLGRSGKLLSYDGCGLAPDLVTFSKGLSDLTFPVAVTCATRSVVSAARLRDAALVDELAVRARYHMGGQIAFSSLTTLLQPEFTEKLAESSRRLGAALDAMLQARGVFSAVCGVGLHLRLVPDLECFPLSWLGPDLAVVLLSRVLLEEGVFAVDLRLLPPLELAPDAIAELVDRLRAVHRRSPRALLAAGLRLFARLAGALLADRLGQARGWRRGIPAKGARATRTFHRNSARTS